MGLTLGLSEQTHKIYDCLWSKSINICFDKKSTFPCINTPIMKIIYKWDYVTFILGISILVRRQLILSRTTVGCLTGSDIQGW